MSALDDLQCRIEELESQAAFREDLQERLSDAVARQDRELRQLKDQLAALARQVLDLGDSLPVDDAGGNENPPHY